MRKLLFVTLSVAILFTATSCRHMRGVKGSGVIRTEKRDVGAFTSIETTGAFEVRVTCQQPESFEIEGDDNILPLVRSEVRNGVLRIFSTGSYNPTKGLTVRITVPNLERVFTTGAGDIHITNVKNDKLELSSTGAARVEAGGQTGFVIIGSTGAGKIDTNQLHAERARVTVTGAGNVDVYAAQQLDATVSGVGNITYAGNPATVNKKVSGVGTINKKASGV